MRAQKNIGIFMDHTNAHLIEYTIDGVQNKQMKSDFTQQDKHDSMQHGEHTANNKEHQKQTLFYNDIADVIEQYNHVLLFGPTDAKTELLNSIKDNHKFENIHIVTETTDKMTAPQMNAYVLNYFKNK